MTHKMTVFHATDDSPTSLPPTPKPGEVWENDSDRTFVVFVNHDCIIIAAIGLSPTGVCSHSDWSNWLTRTNARCVLPAKEAAK